jgi:hypothetical protein
VQKLKERVSRDTITGNGKDILDVTFVSYEAWFHLSGYANSHNNRIWSATNPYEINDTQLHCQKVGVWGAVLGNRIIGPIFLDDTIISERYCVANLCTLLVE